MNGNLKGGYRPYHKGDTAMVVIPVGEDIEDYCPQGHFPGARIMPAVLQLVMMARAVRNNLDVASELRVAEAVFRRPVRPDDTCRIEVAEHLRSDVDEVKLRLLIDEERSATEATLVFGELSPEWASDTTSAIGAIRVFDRAKIAESLPHAEPFLFPESAQIVTGACAAGNFWFPQAWSSGQSDGLQERLICVEAACQLGALLAREEARDKLPLVYSMKPQFHDIAPTAGEQVQMVAMKVAPSRMNVRVSVQREGQCRLAAQGIIGALLVAKDTFFQGLANPVTSGPG
jgi:3-hydroxymyristoyl/3-hydroxydecanoyl-(acyl carrier protein) dehydratase